MSNLPPGVSGNEDAFGPREEYDVEAGLLFECEECHTPAPEVITRLVWTSGAEDVWDCVCGHQNSRAVEEESSFDDPDWGSDE